MTSLAHGNETMEYVDVSAVFWLHPFCGCCHWVVPDRRLSLILREFLVLLICCYYYYYYFI